MMFISLSVAWFLVGFWSHTYWVRNKYDYETSDILTSI